MLSFFLARDLCYGTIMLERNQWHNCSVPFGQQVICILPNREQTVILN